MSTDRRFRQTYALLRSRLSYLPGPQGSKVDANADRGPAGTRWGPCRRCDGIGRTVANTDAACWACRRGEEHRRACAPCGACGGAGRVRYDGYLNAPVGDRVERLQETTEELNERRKRQARRADQIIRGDQPPSDRDERALHAITDRQRGLLASGSYRELDRALLALRDHDPGTYRALLTWVVCGHEGDQAARGKDLLVAPSLRRRLDSAVRWLSVRLPPTIVVPVWADRALTANGTGRWANGYAQERRNAAIRERAVAGVPLRQVAREHGVDERTVRRVCGSENDSGPAVGEAA
jgi:hypothetical protein